MTGVHLGILLFHHVGDLDAAAAVAVASTAAQLVDDPERVRVATVARARFSVQTAGDLTWTPAWAFASAPAFDALLIPGGAGVPRAAEDRATLAYLRRAAEIADPLIGVSSGALLLGAAGLLRGRRATTHPEVGELLAAHETQPATDARTVIDDGLWTAATAADGAALTLELVRRRLGPEVADAVAARLGIEPIAARIGGDFGEPHRR